MNRTASHWGVGPFSTGGVTILLGGVPNGTKSKYRMREPLAALPGVIWGGSRSRRWEFVHPMGNIALQLRVDVDPQVRDLNVCHEEGRPRQAQHNRALVQLALTHLAEVGEARKGDFQQALPDCYINYTDFDGLWVYLIRPALEELDTVDSSSRGKFRYIGDGDNNPSLEENDSNE
jgi:hypothetical protein